MIQTFDIHNLPDDVSVSLCNPSGDELYSLKTAYNKKITLRFNALSEFSFDIPSEVNGVPVDAYDYIVSKKLVFIENYGYFLIVNPEVKEDGNTPVKHVECTSIDGELVFKRLVVFGGTYPLYSILTPEDSIIGKMLELAPSWTVSYIDPSLLVKYRTFDISDSNVYGFLTVDVEQAFGCVFSFDYTNKTISAYAVENATSDTDIFLSFDNVIQNLSLKEFSDEICTVLSVYGGGSLDIRIVNPLGTNNIYNFDYFKTTDWMSADLIAALDSWETTVSVAQASYANTLSDLKIENQTLVTLQSELVELQTEYLVLEGLQKAQIEIGGSLTSINAQLAAKQIEIDNKESEIESSQSTLVSLTESLELTNDALSFENNFTTDQILELSNFMYENTYQNENIIQTDSMTPAEVQDQSQELYDQAVEVLAKVSVPRYEFSMDTINFVALPEFSEFTSQLELGSKAVIERSDETLIETFLLEVSFTFDDPTDFSVTYSNRLRLDNGMFAYADLQGKTVRTGASVSFDNLKWADWADSYKNDVSNFITSALDASTNNIINASNQEILINQNGLRGRTYDEGAGTYDPSQIWMTSNSISFTEDNWQTASLAIGKISYGGSYIYGLVGAAIIGNIIAGNTLRIENDGNNFVLDETGATLNDANFTINSTDGKSRIYLNPDEGIRIETNTSGTWSDKFYVDTSGNIVYSGNLSGASGSFSGSVTATSGYIGTMVIDSVGLKTADGVNYLRGDGTLKWGGLSITPSSATFTGDIYADKLIGAVSYTQLTDIPANKVTSGTMSGNRVYSGSIGGPGIEIALSSTGVPTIYGSSTVRLVSGGGGSVDVSNNVYMYTPNTATIEGTVINLFTGTLRIAGTNTRTVDFAVSTPYGNAILQFRSGLLIGYYYY